MSAKAAARESWSVKARIVTPEGVLEDGAVVVSPEGRIAGVLPQERAAALDCPVVDASDCWLVPGFIDVHVHGGYGADFMEASKEAFDTIASFHGRNGTTSMLATTVTAPKADLDRVLETAQRYAEGPTPYATICGVHLEGPFINSKWCGAQNPEYIVPPRLDWVKEWIERFPGVVKLLTLAPEREGALETVEWLASRGVVCACGHTDSSYDQLLAAADKGLNHAVHTFNAMTGLHHRNPGTVGAVLTDDRICAEIIADGHHVHPACIKLLTQVKRSGNLILITDAISAAGLGNGQYVLGGLDVTVQDGVARLTHGNSLAGSTLTMIDAFRFMVERIGLSVPETSKLASANPARQLGLDSVTGSITEGKSADFVLLTPELQIRGVWNKGNAIHQ